jgi:hypothetical protein
MGGGRGEGGEEYYVPDVETGARTMEEQCPKKAKTVSQGPYHLRYIIHDGQKFIAFLL